MSPPKVIFAIASYLVSRLEPQMADVLELPEPPERVTDPSSEPLEPGELIAIEERRRKRRK